MLQLVYPKSEGFKPENLAGIPTKSGQFSGYYLLGMAVRTSIIGTVDRYICFTNMDCDQVWIEKISNKSSMNHLAFDDTVHIDDEGEFKELLTFFEKKKILDAYQSLSQEKTDGKE